MKTPRRLLFLGLILLAFGISACSFLNSFESEGTLTLPGLKAPVTVHRDEKGMAFIYAQDMQDAIMAQGFVTAQDRLFQMELTRLVATGRICEMAGDEARPLAIRMKTIGFLRNARKHAALLEPETRCTGGSATKPSKSTAEQFSHSPASRIHAEWSRCPTRL